MPQLWTMQNWFKTYYGPNNAVLSLAGDINLQEAKELVYKYFADISPGPSPIKKKSGLLNGRVKRER